jgi:hypothetical protein
MPRVFPPYSNTIARLALAGMVCVPAALFWAAAHYNASSYITLVGVPREQPVPFSHEHHVGDLGLDCRYCHTTVEDSSYANVPPIKTCMTCHSQIWKDSPILEPIRASYRTNIPVQWTRVNGLPDYVYFNHSIHVNKGVGCTTCHGRVDQQPITWRAENMEMAWCLNCHRHPESYLRPRQAVFLADYQPPRDQAVLGKRLLKSYHVQKLQDCYTCHR